MSPLQALKLIAILLGALLSICYAYQFIYLFLPLFIKNRTKKTAHLRRYGILIAARNEEAVLPQLLQSIQNQDYPAQLITTYVVADNCTDKTAQVAAAAGAVVITRTNTRKAGKGHALQYLLQSIDTTCHDAFLIFDADNILSSDYIRKLDMAWTEDYDAFCGYRNSKNWGSSWVSAGHGLWYLHDSIHLSRSRYLVGLPCAVTGTGFGFTRNLLDRMGGWHFFTLTEDIEFSVWCATRGIRIGYCHDAVVYDEQPETLRQSFRQRIRWTQGTIQISFRYAGDMFRGLFRGSAVTPASLEALTLSLWGYVAGILCGILSLVRSTLSYGWLGAVHWLILALAGLYLTGILVGVLTVLSERKRIRASRKQLVLTVFAFPLYLLTYIPIFAAAIFCKRRWTPIEHKRTLSADEMAKL